MGTDDTTDNDDLHSERELWEIGHALTSGDVITINDEYAGLRVSHIRPNAESGDVTEVTLLNDDQETFVIRIVNGEANIPLLTLPSNEQIPITSITPGDDSLLAATSARDLYGGNITDVNVAPHDTYPDDRNPRPDLDSTSITIIGECPKCDCLVAEHEGKAICSGCGSWSLLDQWNAYYDTEHAPDTASTDDTDQREQATLKDAWDDADPRRPNDTASTERSN